MTCPEQAVPDTDPGGRLHRPCPNEVAVRNYLVVCLAFGLAGCGSNEPAYEGKTVSAWVKQTEDRDPAARKEAIETLGKMGSQDPRVLPTLTEALRDDTPSVRSAAAEALGKFGPKAGDAVQPLVVALKDRDKTVRWNAALALGAIDTEGTVAVQPL